MPVAREFRVADRARVEETLDALARRIGTLGGELVLVGIRRRGAPLARALAGRLEAAGGRAQAMHEVTLRRYADDLSLLAEETRAESAQIGFDVRGATVLVVDDVLYTGRTLFRATEGLLAAGAASVHAAVLCARGEPELPVRAMFCGMHLDVGPGHIVEVRVPPYEEELGVVLVPRLEREDLR